MVNQGYYPEADTNWLGINSYGQNSWLGATGYDNGNSWLGTNGNGGGWMQSQNYDQGVPWWQAMPDDPFASGTTSAVFGDQGQTTGSDGVTRHTPDPTAIGNVKMGNPSGASAAVAGGNWSDVNQWDDYIAKASAYYGVPANIIKAHMMIESKGWQTDPNNPTQVLVQQNPNGDSYGLMQITPVAANGAWSGWGWGDQQTKATGVNHDIRTADGNVMMGAYVLRSMYDTEKRAHPDWTEAQLWNAASSMFFVGNDTWSGQDAVNATTGAQYEAMMTGLMTELNNASATSPAAGGNTTVPTMAPDSGNKFVEMAKTFLNYQYILGAPFGTNGPGSLQFDANGNPTAFDCSGFVAYLVQQTYGIKITTGSHEQYDQVGRFVKPDEAMQPGDLVFYNTGTSYRGNGASHVGIYIGNDPDTGHPLMINALNENAGVVVTDMTSDYWTSRFMGAKRIEG